MNRNDKVIAKFLSSVGTMSASCAKKYVCGLSSAEKRELLPVALERGILSANEVSFS